MCVCFHLGISRLCAGVTRFDPGVSPLKKATKFLRDFRQRVFAWEMSETKLSAHFRVVKGKCLTRWHLKQLSKTISAATCGRWKDRVGNWVTMAELVNQIITREIGRSQNKNMDSRGVFALHGQRSLYTFRPLILFIPFSLLFDDLSNVPTVLQPQFSADADRIKMIRA